MAGGEIHIIMVQSQCLWGSAQGECVGKRLGEREEWS